MIFRYCAPDGTLDPTWNINGAINAIAGIVNERGNVLGMMPHPENHVESIDRLDRRARTVRRAGGAIRQGGVNTRSENHARPGRRARAQARRVSAHPRSDRARAVADRTRHLLGDVERALLVQILEGASARTADAGALGDPGAGRECRRHRYRRRACGGLQDGEPQPPELYRALSGRGHRRRRHPARRVHHGRAADRLPERAFVRRSQTSEDASSGVRRGRRHRRLRQFLRRADGRRLGALPHPLRRQQPRQRDGGRPRAHRQDFLRGGVGRRHADRLSRIEDRPRRHPRRLDGVGGVRRGFRGEAPDRAGRRSVRRKAIARGLSRDHGEGLRDRDPGHGRGGADLFGGRDGREGRSRRHARSRQGADARSQHERPTR